MTFNKFTKTLNITNNTYKKGDEYRALLDYAEALIIFKELEKDREQGICLSNMGALRFQIEEFHLAQIRFAESALCLLKHLFSLKKEIKALKKKGENTDLKEAEEKDLKFLLACRLF